MELIFVGVTVLAAFILLDATVRIIVQRRKLSKKRD